MSLTADERAERRAADRQLLTDAVQALTTSEGWQRWLKTRRAFHRYSLHNQLLIAHQRPDATYVYGFRAWIELGYCVRKGERAIRILAPQTVRLHDEHADSEHDQAETRLFFRVVPVFDRGQVDPRPDRDQAPLQPPREPITGDSQAHLLEPLETLTSELG
jgi:antirestriction protein ArdC